MSVENKHADGGRDGRTCFATQILRRERGSGLTMEIKHADTRRDGQTCLAGPNSQALTGIQAECGD